MFRRLSAGGWNSGTLITASDGLTGNHFGSVVSISGDDIAVSASENGVYLFKRTSPDLWAEVQKIDNPGSANAYGQSISLSGDHLIVGARSTEHLFPEDGAAYVYHRIAEDTWDDGTMLTSPHPQQGANFGISVGMHGDYAIVGASNGEFPVGDAYVFHRIGPNEWDSGTKLTPPDGEGGAFGIDVDIDGEYAIVGAFTHNGVGQNSGAAYIFSRTGDTSWDEGVIVVAPDGRPFEHFGRSVSIDEGIAVVGTYSAEAAYVFRQNADNSWSLGTKITSPESMPDDYFGSAISNDGHFVIVGAPGDNNEFGSDAGSAYAY